MLSRATSIASAGVAMAAFGTAFALGNSGGGSEASATDRPPAMTVVTPKSGTPGVSSLGRAAPIPPLHKPPKSKAKSPPSSGATPPPASSAQPTPTATPYRTVAPTPAPQQPSPPSGGGSNGGGGGGTGGGSDSGGTGEV